MPTISTMALTTPDLKRDEGRSAVLVSRQPVLDAADRVIGYRVAYALHDDNGPVAPSAPEAIDLLDEVLEIIGSEEQALGSRAHLPVSREMLLHHGDALPIASDQVVLRVRLRDALDPAVAIVVERASLRGYSFELDGLDTADVDPALLRHFKTVEADLGVLSGRDAAALCARIRLRGTIGLAAGLSSHEEREQARAAGFQWFSGPFLATPNLIDGKPVPVGNMRTLVDLSRLQGTEVDLDALIDVIELDVGLGVRLLRYINSAYFGLSGQVRSVRHAATMLGAKGLARWALVAASVGSGEQIPREHALLALTRARTCELLHDQRPWGVDPDLLFTIGLLSAVDVVFRMPLQRVVDDLGLSEVTTDALVNHSGPAGEILDSVITYEQGDFQAPSLRDSLAANGEAYRAGLAWAREAVSGVS
jgi:c-di-GMP phosphodiesterase